MRLEEIEWHDIELEPEEAVRNRAPIEALPAILRLGRPIVLDALEYLRGLERADPTVEALSANSDFYYIRLPLSIRPEEGLSVHFLALDCMLAGEGGSVDAYSMEPLKVEDEVKVALSAKLSSTLTLGLAKLSAEVGDQEQYVIFQPLIEAFNIGTSEPAWEFRPSKGRRLGGVQILHLIIRQSKGTKVEGRITLRADIKDERGLALFPYFGRLSRTRQRELTFYCPDKTL